MTTSVRLKLERIAHTEHGTFGVMSGGEFWAYTCEDPWLDNEANISCIPLGVYTVVRHPTEKHPQGWLLTNVPERYAIMIHPGNNTDDTQGCILLGDSLGVIFGRWSVMNSKATQDKLEDLLEGVGLFVLDIVEADPYNRYSR